MLIKLLKLDIYDINFRKNYISGHKDTGCYLHTILWSLFKTTLGRSKKEIELLSSRENKSIKNKVICIYGTRNQLVALSSIVDNIDEAVFCDKDNREGVHLFISLGYLLSWFFMPLLISKYFFRPQTKEKVNLAGFISNYFFLYGGFLWFTIYFSLKKPKAIFVANDHSPFFRLLKEVCKYLDLPIGYIQHASTNSKFPKLDFDISLLEGKDAYNKYMCKGIESKVHIVGMAKFDGYLDKINSGEKFNTLGLAVNILDQTEKIKNLCDELSKKLESIQIILRPHPRDKRIRLFKEICQKQNLRYSNSNQESPFDFLQSTDVLISSESSIHLEAALMNVYPIYYKFGKQIKDNYGYIDNNLITNVFENPKHLISFLKDLQKKRPHNVRDRCKYYVSTVGTEYDGKSGELIKNILSKELNLKEHG